jgi:hypothetical protein
MIFGHPSRCAKEGNGEGGERQGGDERRNEGKNRKRSKTRSCTPDGRNARAIPRVCTAFSISHVGLTHVLFLLHAFLAVVGVRDSCPSADDAASGERPVVALLAHLRDDGGADVRVADDALAIAALAQPADGDARLLAAHDQVGVCMGDGEGRRAEGSERGLEDGTHTHGRYDSRCRAMVAVRGCTRGNESGTGEKSCDDAMASAPNARTRVCSVSSVEGRPLGLPLNA